jgi:lipopolysaccharide transport system ATP-binding protein
MCGLRKPSEALQMSYKEEIAIDVQGVSKVFHIYENPVDRLKHSIMPRVRRLLGLKPGSYCRDFNALKDISFSVAKGGAVGILGKNGAGKSTLLQIICQTLSPSLGQVSVHGKVAALLELGAGFNPEFTGRENVYLNASILGMSEEAIDERYDDILAFADIGEFIDQPVKIYSSGMYVRLAFAVIAHVDADILIIDEALSVGDVFFTQKCMRFLREFKKKGTLLFVSHDTSSIVNFCDTCIWLEAGKVKEEGSAKSVTESYLQGLYDAVHQEALVDRDDTVEQEADYDNQTQVDASEKTTSIEILHDQRMSIFNASSFRNDIEIFQFDSEARSANFGIGGGSIYDICIQNDAGSKLSWVVGGEKVQLSIFCKAKTNIRGPIIGFLVKDKLGQIIFGDNTFLNTAADPLEVTAGGLFNAIFSFVMPVMPNGDYSIAVAIAEGSQDNHIQHEWIHDALIFKAHASSACHGLIGVPMDSIRMDITK